MRAAGPDEGGAGWGRSGHDNPKDSSQKTPSGKQGQGVRSPATDALDPTAGRASGRPFKSLVLRWGHE